MSERKKFMTDASINVPQVTVKTYTDEEGRVVTVKTETVEDKSSIMTKVTTTTETAEAGKTVVRAHKEKLSSALNGGAQLAPTDNGLSTAEKTPEQQANLAKLADARKYLQGDAGIALADAVTQNDGDLTRKQKRALKKAGIDPDAFLQAMNEKKADGGRYNATKAAEKLDDMGALANAFLGEDTPEFPQNRQSSRKDGVRDAEKRNFLQKLFTKKEKQNVKDSDKYSDNGGTKVNIHSSQDVKRNAEFAHDISDDVARAGNEFLDAYESGYRGKKREKFTEIDENGNVVKTKVIYNKDGSVKKVVKKSDENGKIVLKEAKDGHITVKGHLQSDNIMKDAREEEYMTIIKEVDVQTTITEKCDQVPPPPTPPVPPPPTPPVPPPPTPPVPPPVKVEEKPGGLIQDFVNDDSTNGMGSVQGISVREQFEKHGAAEMANAYCSYTDETVPEQAKKVWPKNTAYCTNKYNGQKLAQSLINDAENQKVNEKALGELITELRNQGNTAALRGVKEAISRHNRHVKKLAPEKRGFDETTRTVNKFVTTKEMAVVWLMQSKDI